MNFTAKHILVKGKVQGVFFRKGTKQVAEALGITGWVKNTDNGDVEIFAQGTETAIEEFILWCWQGSPKSHVETVEIENIATNPAIKIFSVQH